MITNLGTATGVLAAASPDNWYSVKVNSPQTLNLNLQAAFGTPSMTLVDPSGKQVASSGGATRTNDGWINATLAAGTYFARVSSSNDNDFTLSLSAAPLANQASTSRFQ